MHTDKHAIFAAWAPLHSPWSRWAKPAVFAHIPAELEIPATTETTVEVSAYPESRHRCAVVIDLPGPQAVATGLALARIGYRPVPLFNSCPPSPDDAVQMIAAVDARAVLVALVGAAPELATLSLPVDAPPVFLLDSLRSAPGVGVGVRMFDNRSAVFASDFPSAEFLRGQGIHLVRLVHDAATAVGDDLRYALRHWPAGGMVVDTVTPCGEPLPWRWPSDGVFGEICERLKAMFSLRRHPTGGFGRLVPEASGG
jgi:hypothetical protein